MARPVAARSARSGLLLLLLILALVVFVANSTFGGAVDRRVEPTARNAPFPQPEVVVTRSEPCPLPEAVVPSRSEPCPVCAPADGGWVSNTNSESSSGKLWSPVAQRSAEDAPPIVDPAHPPAPIPRVGSLVCDKWVVTTTIFEPTELAHQVARHEDWCMVVVGDKKTPDESVWSMSDRVVFLPWEDQLKLPYAIVPLLKFNHFGRKNIGFIYAIHHGARVIYDTDDDNFLNKQDLTVWADILTTPGRATLEHRTVPVDSDDNAHLVNPYPMFGSALKASDGLAHEHFVWPRGFPLEAARDAKTFTLAALERTDVKIGVLQSLADHDPDVDGIYRLTQPLPLVFTGREDPILALGRGNFAPFNAQVETRPCPARAQFTPSSPRAALLAGTKSHEACDPFRRCCLNATRFGVSCCLSRSTAA